MRTSRRKWDVVAVSRRSRCGSLLSSGVHGAAGYPGPSPSQSPFGRNVHTSVRLISRLDNALHMFMEWTKKAVALDTLDHEDMRAKCSSSAIHVMEMFYQNKTATWKILDVRDTDAMFKYGAKLIGDLCRCTVFYAEEMRRKADRMSSCITPEWCTTVNNIEYVSHSLTLFHDELEKDLVPLVQHRKQHLHELIEKAAASMHEEVLRLLDSAAERLTSKVRSWLDHRLDHRIVRGRRREDKLAAFLGSNLQLLHAQLSDRSFDHVLAATWASTLRALRDGTARAPETSSPRYYAAMQGALELLGKVFSDWDPRHQLSPVGAAELERQLIPRALSTAEYMHLYLRERLAQQAALTDASLGMVTVCAQFVRDRLCMEVLSARDIQSLHTRGPCNPYLTIQLLPREDFKSTKKIRSKVHKATLFPLFELKATFALTAVQLALAGAMVRLAVKEKKHFHLSRGALLGEAFVPFRDILVTEAESESGQCVRLRDLPQVHFKLSRPALKESRAFRALELRMHDDKARKFVKKERAKVSKET